MEKVVVLKCEDYGDIVQEKVDKIFNELGGVENLFKKGQKVVLKVNLVRGIVPERNATTHPKIVECVARRLIEFGCECIIADSPGGPFTASHLKGVYLKSGMTNACENVEGLKLNDDFSSVMLTNQNNLMLKEIEVMNILNECDVIVNIAKFKTHTFMGYTGAVKNMFGAIPGLVKVEMHSRFTDQDVFGDMLIDINETLKEKIVLNIVDAIWGMEGQGPTNGKSLQIGYLLASRNAYALDAIQTRLMTKNIEQFSLIQQMKKRDLINDELEIVGEIQTLEPLDKIEIPKIDKYVLKKAIPVFIQPLFHKLMTRRPVIKKRKCRGCGKCFSHCPVQAITMCKKKNNKRYAKVDYQKCIRCFCCQELCPFNAVKIKAGILHKLIRLKPKKK